MSDIVLSVKLGNQDLTCIHRRRIYIEEKARIYSILIWSIGWIHSFLHIILAQFILFFQSSWWKIARTARIWIIYPPQTAATTFAFSSVSIFLQCSWTSYSLAGGGMVSTSWSQMKMAKFSAVLVIPSLNTPTSLRHCWLFIIEEVQRQKRKQRSSLLFGGRNWFNPLAAL